MKLLKKVINKIQKVFKRISKTKNSFIQNKLPPFGSKSLCLSSVYALSLDTSCSRPRRAVFPGRAHDVAVGDTTKAPRAGGAGDLAGPGDLRCLQGPPRSPAHRRGAAGSVRRSTGAGATGLAQRCLIRAV